MQCRIWSLYVIHFLYLLFDGLYSNLRGRVYINPFLLCLIDSYYVLSQFNILEKVTYKHDPSESNKHHQTKSHRRPLRLGKKTRHNHIRAELKNKPINMKAGTGTYKDLMDQDIEIDPSVMIVDPTLERVNDSHPPSILKFDNVTTKNKFSILSMVVDHSVNTKWMVPSFHAKYSAGWNRTTLLDFNLNPMSCHIRFYAIGTEENLEGFQEGGTGFLSFNYETPWKKKLWFWYDESENNGDKVFCYYMTNKHTGSEFIDKPKTLGIAIYCPVTLDLEVGPYEFKKEIVQGNVCRKLADYSVEMTVTLRETNLTVTPPFDKTQVLGKKEITADIVTTPAGPREHKIRNIIESEVSTRYHAVCVVQTFRNPQSGPMLFLFVQHWYRLGWKVIIYDRFGMHKEFIEEMLDWSGFDYHPYTAYQLVNPEKYNLEFAAKRGNEFKVFYKMEKNWGYKGSVVDDIGDQDGDKTKTYDFARVEYAYLHSILFVDSDEFLFCPQANNSLSKQIRYQRKLMDHFSSQGVQEMRFVRTPFGATPPKNFSHTRENRANTDLTEEASQCMIRGYVDRNVPAMFGCWSEASSFDNFQKSSDFAGMCPFHYNHWSCDGWRNGGRDAGPRAPRCKCRVAFDMTDTAYIPRLDRCYLAHFHDSKYRFQSRRSKHEWDGGNSSNPNPIAVFYKLKQNEFREALGYGIPMIS